MGYLVSSKHIFINTEDYGILKNILRHLGKPCEAFMNDLNDEVIWNVSAFFHATFLSQPFFHLCFLWRGHKKNKYRWFKVEGFGDG